MTDSTEEKPTRENPVPRFIHDAVLAERDRAVAALREIDDIDIRYLPLLEQARAMKKIARAALAQQDVTKDLP